MRQTQGTLATQTPDRQPWLDFFLRAMQQQKARLERKLERERVTVAEAAMVTGANRNTIKDHIRALTRAGRLEKHGAGRGTWYLLGG